MSIEDPLTLLERLEHMKRGAARSEGVNPAVCAVFIANLARAIVNPELVDEPRMDYRPRGTRAVILARLAIVFRIPAKLVHDLAWDLDVAVQKVLDEQEALMEQQRLEEIE